MENTKENTEKKANKVQQHIIELKNDKKLIIIILLHLLLAACHLCFNLFSDIKYHAEFRAAGCITIAILILLFGRRGMSYGFLLYACTLIYINTFYNYGTIFFLLIAYGAYPRIKWPAVIIYGINVFVSFSFKQLIPIAILIHFIYLGLFLIITLEIYKVKAAKTLKLKDDEKYILDQLKEGKLQKEIGRWSQQSITAKLKNARERNMIETTSELLAQYTIENKNGE